MTDAFLRNFEAVKLSVSSPDLVNAVLLCVLCAAALLTLKQTSPSGSVFLSPVQTDQMKGAAILLVILGHVWFHVAGPRASIILSGDAIAFFFLLSGFGLTVAASNRAVSLRTFCSRRVQRVMVPYWCATGLVLLLDYVLLARTYAAETIIMTLLGVNMTPAATHLDYVRWYITLQLLWYILFFFIVVLRRNRRAVVLLTACAAIIFVGDYYLTRQGWSQLFAFPAGCACGLHYERLRSQFVRFPRHVLSAAGAAIIWVLLYKAAFEPLITPVAPQIACKLLREANGILVALGVCALIAQLGCSGYASRFLLLCGGLSYELFLLHGPLLIKYNPVIRSGGTLALLAQYALFLCLLLPLAWLFRKLIMLMRGDRAADKSTR